METDQIDMAAKLAQLKADTANVLSKSQQQVKEAEDLLAAAKGGKDVTVDFQALCFAGNQGVETPPPVPVSLPPGTPKQFGPRTPVSATAKPQLVIIN